MQDAIKALQDSSSSRKQILQALATLYCHLAAEDKIDGTAFDMSVLDRLDSTRISGVGVEKVVHNPKAQDIIQSVLEADLGRNVEVIGNRIYVNKKQVGTLDKVCIAYTLNEDL